MGPAGFEFWSPFKTGVSSEVISAMGSAPTPWGFSAQLLQAAMRGS